MRASLGQPIIVENVSGADGSVGTGRAARARPDGYTIELGTTPTHVLNGALYWLRYDVLNDFVPISLLATAPNVLFARKDMPATDVNELTAWLKVNPNKASAGIVSAGHRLLTAVFQKETGTKFTLVPYRGTAPQLQDAIAGQIDLFFDTPVQLPLVRAARIKAYAVTSDMRLELAPEIPTFGEMGLPALSYSAWYGLFAPKGTSREIIDTLNGAVVEALTDPTARSRLVDFGIEVVPRARQAPEILGTLVRADAEKWWPIIKETGIKAQ
jgi:tripartite-type tricarboxylate transporter receptor subunit TctC